MELFSDTHDVYLNGKLQSYVVSADEKTGTVLLVQQDYRTLRSGSDPEAALIVAGDPNGPCGFDTIECKGDVTIKAKEQNRKTDGTQWMASILDAVAILMKP